MLCLDGISIRLLALIVPAAGEGFAAETQLVYFFCQGGRDGLDFFQRDSEHTGENGAKTQLSFLPLCLGETESTICRGSCVSSLKESSSALRYEICLCRALWAKVVALQATDSSSSSL